jgi:hypothetical protein
MRNARITSCTKNRMTVCAIKWSLFTQIQHVMQAV